MGEGDPGRLLVEDRQRLAVQRGTALRLGDPAGLADQLVELLVTPAGLILATRGGGAGQVGGEEVVRVAVVAGPAHEHQVVLAVLGALDQLAPLEYADVGGDAYGGQVGLQHLCADARVGVCRAAARASPDRQLQAFCMSGLGQQLAGAFEVLGPGLQAFVVAEQGGRVGRRGQAGVAFAVLGAQVGLAVEGQVDGLAHAHIIQRLVPGVDGDIGGEQRVQLQHLQVLVLAQRRHVARARKQRHLAGASLELLNARVGIGGDGQQQAVERRLAAPVVRVAGEAHLGVLGVAFEDEGAGADRLAVELFRRFGVEQLFGVLGGIDGGEAHGQVGEERRLGVFQGEAHAVFVERPDLGDQLGEAHSLEIGEAARGQLVPVVLLVALALEAPQHVVGIQFAARREPGRLMKFHPLAQGEGVGQAVGADLPALGQGGDDAGAAGGELHQALVDRLGRGIGGGGGGVLDDVEAFRGGLGADHQGLRLGEHRQAGAQGQRHEQAAHECFLLWGERAEPAGSARCTAYLPTPTP